MTRCVRRLPFLRRKYIHRLRLVIVVNVVLSLVRLQLNTVVLRNAGVVVRVVLVIARSFKDLRNLLGLKKSILLTTINTATWSPARAVAHHIVNVQLRGFCVSCAIMLAKVLT